MSIAYRRAHSVLSGPTSLPRLFESVATLCQASQGSIALVEALRRIGNLLGTEVTALCRVNLSTPQDTARAFSHDAHRPLSENPRPLVVSFAHGVCSENIAAARPGSIWRGTLEDFAHREQLARFFQNRRLAETIVIPLQRKNGYGDFLELHFFHQVSADLLANIENMGPVMADCWKNRSLGLFSESILSRHRVPPAVSSQGPILSVENPCGLSRAEYRVCMLLSRGLNNEAVLSELSITMATLRTHLRNVYAKTDSASQPELIHKLLCAATRDRISRENVDVA